MKAKTTKQTAANNPFLAKVKRVFNKHIYKEASRLVNEDTTPKALAFVEQYINVPFDKIEL